MPDDEESSKEDKVEEEERPDFDSRLFVAVERRDAASVLQSLLNGANVNSVRKHFTPLMTASGVGFDEIVGVLLIAGADARWRNNYGSSAIMNSCYSGHLSTVQLLIIHDTGLLEIADDFERTPLIVAIRRQHSDIVRFLLDSGADHSHVDQFDETPLMTACGYGNLETVRMLLAVGVNVEARDRRHQTALHFAARRDDIEVVRELILQHNANMFIVDGLGFSPFDLACRLEPAADVVNHLLEMYGNKLTQDHGNIAHHELLKVTEYSFAEKYGFHPPLNPLRIILPLGELTLMHLRTLLYTFDPELIRNRDDTGKLPIHIACQTNAPVEVFALILEHDPAVLHIADNTGALPIHLLCGTTAAATEYASVRYLVEQGGVGTLAARDHQGALPLHILSGSTNPPLRAVQYLIQSFPESVAVQTNAGHYPFMMAAAADSSSVSLSVVYEIVRANPNLIVPR